MPEPGCRVSVVTPAYDELANLRELLPRLRGVLESEPDLDAEVLVVLPAWAPPHGTGRGHRPRRQARSQVAHGFVW